MSRTIDSRVVEMRFDNKQFESGVKQTMSTLERFKTALKFTDASKGLENLNAATKNVSLDGISAGIERLNQRFSTLGIVGMRIIQNITDGLMNKLGRAVNYVTDSIVSGGIKRAMNLENAHFQLQSILNDEVKVQEVMQAANDSVDGTAYSFDVAAKAASQFTASGITDMDQLAIALRAMAGTTATFNADYESMSMIFTQVAGQGRLMGDQLLQLSTRGANAAATIANFVRGVNDGSIKVSDSVRASVENISTSMDVTEADIRDVVSEGQVNFEAFAAAMNWAFGDSAKKANETFNGAFANIKAALARIGAGFVSPLVEQNSEIVRLFNSVREKVNQVKKALVFDEEIGNIHALSKQFTDSVLSIAGNLANAIDTADISDAMSTFYYGVEIVKNGFKGLYSILKPVGQAFKEVFLSFTGDDVVNLAASLKSLTDNFKLSEESSRNLHDAMYGLFSVSKLLIELFVKLLGAVLSIDVPISDLGNGFLGLAGSAGRMLTSFTECIRTSPTVAKAFEAISLVSDVARKAIVALVLGIVDFIKNIQDFPAAQKLIDLISKSVQFLGETGKKYFSSFIGDLKNIKAGFENLDISKPSEIFDKIAESIKKLLDVAKSNEGLTAFVNNIKEFGTEIRNAFTLGNLTDKINSVMDTLGRFVDFIKNILGPAFENFSIGGALATGGGIGIIYALIKGAKALDGVAKSIKAIPDIFGAAKGALEAWQADLRADALLKIAAAVAALGAALTVMSFADPKRLIAASAALSLLAGTLMSGIAKLKGAANKGRELNDVLNTFASGFSSAMSNFGKALKIKAIGSTVKKFAESIAVIAVSMIALGVMYKKDKDSLMAAVGIISGITAVLIAAMGLGTLLGSFAGTGMRNFSKGASAMTSLALSVGIVVLALDKLFKMEIPNDWLAKVVLLAGIIGGTATLAIALGAAGRISGGNNIKSGPILALAATLLVTVTAVKKIFEMEIPNDWLAKVVLLAGVFGGVGALILAVGAASKLAGGALKGAGTLLAMSVLLVTVVGSLMVLSVFPGAKLLKGAVALGGVLVALGYALHGATAATDSSSWKSVIAMSVAVGTITASLGLLSMIPWQGLLKGAVALGGVLLAIAQGLKSASAISDNSAAAAIIAMVASVGVIAYSLYELSGQPWSGMLAAATAMSATLLAFAGAFKIISNSKDISIDKIALFLLATTSVIPIGIALYELSGQPWSGMLAAAADLSGTLLAFAGAFKIISASKPNIAAIGTFLLATLSIIPIGLALYELSKQPWQGLLAATASIVAVLGALTGVLVVCTTIGPLATNAIPALLVFDLFIANFAAVLAALGAIFKSEGAKALIGGGAQILVQIGQAIGDFVGAIINGVLSGITSALPQIATDLSTFMTNLMPFIIGSKMLDAGALTCVGYLAGIIIALSVAEFVDGIAKLFGLSLSSVAEELSNFMVKLQPFIVGSSMLNEGSAKACAYIAAMILALTASEIIAGIGKMLGLGGNLSSFGEELSKFGPHIKKFADVVKDVKPEAVQGAASAAKIMAEVASNLPAQGGLVQKMFGEKKLSDFGMELVAFGPSIKMFATIVKDVNPEAVEGAASAAKIMSEVEANLPAQGGLVQKIFGSKKLSDFGAELVAFGPLIRQFASSVNGMNPSSVTGVATVTAIMSDLATNLPSSDTLWEKIFGGSESISSFGNELVKFGASMTKFSNSVSGINPAKVTAAVGSFKELTDLAKYMDGTTASGIVDFAKNLEKIAKDSVDKFAEAFGDAGSKTTKGVNKFFSNFNKILDSAAKTSASSSMDKAAGYYVDGLAKGLRDRMSSLTSVGTEMGNAVSTALNKRLEIESPSKDSYRSGAFYGDGFVGGGKSKLPEIKAIGTKMGETLSDSTQSSLDLEKTYQVYGDALQPIVEETQQAAEAIETVQVEQEKNNIEHVENAKKTSQARAQIQMNTVVQEQDFWTKLLTIRKTGQDAEKYQDMDMKTFQEETLESAKEIYDNYVSEYESAVDRMASAYDIFSEVEQKEVKNKRELKNILTQQIYDYNEYTNTLQSLNERLDGTQLIEYLRELGVDSTDQLKVMNSMSDEELTAYSNLYDEKLAAANRAAQAQMVDLKAQTEADLNALFGSMHDTVSLVDFSQMFDGSLDSLNKYLNDIFVPMETAADKAAQESKLIGEAISSGILTSVETDLNSLLGTTLDTNLSSALTATSGNVGTASGIIGTNINAGIVEGMKNTEGLNTAAQSVMDSIILSLQTAGEIASPSGRTKREVGTFLTEGVASGMIDPGALSQVTSSVTEIINGIVTSFTEGSTPIYDSVKNIMTQIGTSIQTTSEQLSTSANNIPVVMASGIQANGSQPVDAMKVVADNIVTTTQGALSDSTFSTMGQDLINAISSGISSVTDALITKVQTVCTSITTKFSTSFKSTTFSKYGTDMLLWIQQGLDTRTKILTAFVVTTCLKIIDEFKKNIKDTDYKPLGTNSLLWIQQGMETQHDPLITYCTTVSADVMKAFSDNIKKQNFYDLGYNAAIGLKEGIEARVKEIRDAAISAARSAVSAAKSELDEASPSKVFHKIGEYVSIGLANGIIDRTKDVSDAGTMMAGKAVKSMDEVVDSISKIIDSEDFENEPVIHPIVDLSNVNQKFDEINRLFNRKFDLSGAYDVALDASSTFIKDKNKVSKENERDSRKEQNITYEFTQNNYSPKALTRSEIYRQTNNQFSAFRKAVNLA